MTEADMYGPLWRGANAAGWRLFRVADGSVGKKPADLAGCSPHGAAVLVEAKLVDRRRAGWDGRFPHLPSYRSHQLGWARAYAEAGAVPLLVEADAGAPLGVLHAFLIVDPTQADPLTVRLHPGRVEPPPCLELVLVGGPRPGDAQVYAGWQAVLTAHSMHGGRAVARASAWAREGPT